MIKTKNHITQVIHDDCLNALKDIASNSVDLCIADPPYWKVIGEKWDYQWRTEEDYLKWCEPWLREIGRTLRYGGSFYLFGYFRISGLISDNKISATRAYAPCLDEQQKNTGCFPM